MNSHYGRNRAPKSVYLAASIVIFFLSLSAADSVGFVPDYLDGTAARPAADESVALSNLPELGEGSSQLAAGSLQGILPERIIISQIDLDLPVQNPDTRDVAELDALLQKGPARYVDSAKLGEKGNVLIFAHSSHLPVIHNQMYKAFNRIPDLTAGDTITVAGAGKSFVYSVTSVRRVDVGDEDASIDLAVDGHKLTLVTCDTLTGKSARFVLEADFVAEF